MRPAEARKSRAERVGEVLAVVWYLLWLGTAVRLLIEMDTWLFRIAAAAAVYIGYRFWRFSTNNARSWR